MSAQLPKLEIAVAEGRTIFTRVLLDGRQLPVTRVAFDTGESLNGMVKVRLEFYADLSLNATGQKLLLTSLDE